MKALAAAHCLRRLPRWSSAAIFNLAWFSCVTANNALALMVTLLYLLFHAIVFVQSHQEYRYIAVLALVGVFLDSVLNSLDIIHFSHSIDFGIIKIVPVWMMCLWLCFATTLHHGFHWLHQRLWLGAAMAIFSVPSSYYVGARLSGSSIDNLMLMLSVYALVWAVVFPLALRAAR